MEQNMPKTQIISRSRNSLLEILEINLYKLYKRHNQREFVNNKVELKKEIWRIRGWIKVVKFRSSRSFKN